MLEDTYGHTPARKAFSGDVYGIGYDATGRVTSMQLDYVLWNRGQQARYKAEPRHRTRTVFY